MKKLLLSAAALILSLGASACSMMEPKTNVSDFSSQIAASLHAQALSSALGSDPVIATSFVDIRDLGRTSSMGAMASELVTDKLVQMGHDVKDVRVAKGYYVGDGGEFILSLEIRDHARGAKARSVLVGTYSVGDGVAYVSSRLIRLSDDRVLASASVVVDIDDRHRSIFGGSSTGRMTPMDKLNK